MAHSLTQGPMSRLCLFYILMEHMFCLLLLGGNYCAWIMERGGRVVR